MTYQANRLAAACVAAALLLLFDASARGAQRSGGGRKRQTTQQTEVDVRARSHMEEGLRHADAGDWAEAVKSYKLALAVSPNFAEAHLNLGDAYMSAGNY
ncbi:MAG TPA: tetratricopeptide repeat protein, partial [Pyrinomonadaceae bacterium]|nr:tetratricopeptide repeat protein [Pyrinomonadaceae bacterium]